MGSTEVAALLGVSPATIARAVQSGRLKTSEVTPGGHSRFSEADLRAFRSNGRQGQSRSAQALPGPEQSIDLADLAGRIDARIQERYGGGLTGGDLETLIARLDDVADAIATIIERPRPTPTLAPPFPEPPPPEQVLPILAPDTSIFEDGNSGITLVIRPIERFALIETITGLLAAVQGVGEIRLRRLQRGVAWFTIRYSGALPVPAVFTSVLTPLSAEVVATGERMFEATLPGPEGPAAGGPPRTADPDA